MSIEHFMNNKTLVVILDGEIDHHTCVAIKEGVDKAYQRKRAKNLLFDFEKVSFMDSSGVGMLMGRYRNVVIGGGTIGLYNVSEEAARILKMSGVSKLMKSYATKEEALEALA